MEEIINYLPSDNSAIKLYEDYLEGHFAVDEYGSDDIQKLGEQMFKFFPEPIGLEMQRLFTITNEKDGEKRFKQMIVLFDKLLKFIMYVNISFIWKLVMEKKIVLNDNFRNKLEKWLQKPATLGTIVGLLIASFKNLENSNILFLNRYDPKTLITKSLKNKLGAFVKIRNYDSHDKELEEEIDLEHVEELLAEIVKKFSFIIQMKLILIEDITVQKQLFRKPYFEHFINNFYTKQQEKTKYDNFYENNTIILIDNIENPEFYLNLSPLIIHINKSITSKGRKFLKTRIKSTGLFSKKDANGIIEYKTITPSKLIKLETYDYNIHLFKQMQTDLLNTKTSGK